MLDINLIRKNPDKVKKACKQKGVDPKVVDRLLKIDEQRRQLIADIQDLRQKRNELMHGISKKPDKKTIEQGKKLKNLLARLEPDLQAVEEQFQNLMLQIPNIPAADVPVGKDESGNKTVKKWGKIAKFSFKPKDHLELAEKLNLIDVERAAKVSGTRFGYLKNEAVLLEFALVQHGFKLLIKEGFIPVVPPELTRVSVFHKLGYSQHGANKDYYLVYDPKKEDPKEEANYYLVGTAEHALVPMHKDEILNYRELPKRYVGFSSAFRREAGSYGKDTRGIFRVHQFDKLEMISFIEPQPEADKKEHQYLLSLEEKLVQSLSIPYQVVKMCTGDVGQPAARKYDIECWFPAEKRYRETHSVSTCTDFQSRALNIKYLNKDGKTDFVHVLNGTAFAIGRILLAILENYQQKDGSVKIPKILQRYVGKKVIRRNKK